MLHTETEKKNLQYRINPKSWKIPVMFHNLRGYNENFIINAASNEHTPIRVIPTNMERFMAFSIERLQYFGFFTIYSTTARKIGKNLERQRFRIYEEGISRSRVIQTSYKER